MQLISRTVTLCVSAIGLSCVSLQCGCQSDARALEKTYGPGYPSEATAYGMVSIGWPLMPTRMRVERDLIRELPQWPSQGNFDAADWNAYLTTAARLQTYDRGTLESIFACFALDCIDRSETINEYSASVSPLIILTRLMFVDPSSPFTSEREQIGATLDYVIPVPCGNLPFHRLVSGTDDDLPMTAPVGWEGGAPTLTALRKDFDWSEAHEKVIWPPDSNGVHPKLAFKPISDLRYFQQNAEHRDLGVAENDYWRPYRAIQGWIIYE